MPCQRCLDVDKEIVKIIEQQAQLRLMIQEQIISENVRIEQARERICRMKQAIDFIKGTLLETSTRSSGMSG
jgi:hypothetical protein